MLQKFLLKHLDKYASKWLVLAIDVCLVLISFAIAYVIRFNLSFNFDKEALFNQIPIVFVASLFSFLLVGSYKGVIRHTGVRDAFNVFIATLIIGAILMMSVFVNWTFNVFKPYTIPVSIVAIHYLLNTGVLITSRFIFKMFYEVISTELETHNNVLIYGAGESGIITYTAITRERNNPYNVIGFIDDDKRKVNKNIDRKKIYDFSKITEKFIKKHHINDVIISIQQISSNRLFEITDQLIKLGVDVKIVPPISKWVDGNLNANQIERLNIDDLLEREPIVIDNPIVNKEVADKVIFVTGAAGSIGSEISRQLAKYPVKMLILLDHAESQLYDLQQELIQSDFKKFKAIVTDVRDVARMNKLFEAFKPHKVFHAAAYKHVPLMESNPYEAVNINVFGTKTIVDLSVKYNVDRFVMISTDKAVNPTNVMGATKRVAELYVEYVSDRNSNTKFTITRFGNVLGSNGSVVPLFKKQIKNGGPITVTHKDITRFFMTIPEACSLVLEAGTMGTGGEIYIFDMGKSVKIFDMAKRMISLSGFKYPEDIDIKITGLRPGEKLYEELLASSENTIKTYHPKIMIAKISSYNNDNILEQLNQLNTKKTILSNSEIVSMIKDMVPEFISNNSVFEKLDLDK